VTRGRKPKPTERKRLEGNPGRRRLNASEPEPPAPVVAFDEPPPELAEHAIAADEWRRLAPMLRKARQITDADRSALVALCVEWQRYLDATRHVKRVGMVVKTPSGYPMTNPYLSIARASLIACGRLWSELGLTPSSRSRVQTTEPLPAPDDPFTEFDAPPRATTSTTRARPH